MEDTRSESVRRPRIDPGRCTRCLACIEACPRGAIEEPSNFRCARCMKYCLTMQVPCTPPALVVCQDLCDGCGLCIDTCPHEAIRWCDEGLDPGCGRPEGSRVS